MKFGDKSISVKNSLYTDANFFQFFSFGLKLGAPNEVLTGKNSIVLTEEIANRLFGMQNPVGTTITCNNQTFVVSGIARNVPANSHIYFDVVFPLEPLITAPGVYIAWNGGMDASTFIKLHHAGQQTELAAKLPDFLWKKINKAEEGTGFFSEFVLEPFPKIHLYSSLVSVARVAMITPRIHKKIVHAKGKSNGKSPNHAKVTTSASRKGSKR